MTMNIYFNFYCCTSIFIRTSDN